jgi:MFS family permease
MSCLAIFLDVFQYTFLDPFLADFLFIKYGISQSLAGFVFFCPALGYFISCNTVHILTAKLTSRRVIVNGFFLMGAATIMYGPSRHLGFDSNLIFTMIALFLAGISSAYALLPTLPEILVETEKRMPA